MTATTGFILAATLIVLTVLSILLHALLRKPKTTDDINHQQANLDIIRDQLTELERNRTEGLLTEPDFVQAKNELQRRLLDETTGETNAPPRASGRKTALALLIALPFAAAAGYTLLGTPQALDPMRTQARMGAQEIDAMLDKLVAKLNANPSDTKGWVMLARSYKALGRFSAAAEAYSHGGELVDNDPTLLADYAEVVAQSNQGKLEGQPLDLIKRALKIDPDEPQALFLAGAAAIDRKDFSAAVEFWGRLLPQLQPGSDEARALGDAVEKARQFLSKNGHPNQKNAPSSTETSRQEMISGRVSISDQIAAQVRPNDVVFIFARATDGSRMPLAAIRTRVDTLPLDFRLDDTQALPGGQKISEFKSLTIEARVAKAGRAQISSGDLFGKISNVKPGDRKIRLVIDQVQP